MNTVAVAGRMVAAPLDIAAAGVRKTAQVGVGAWYGVRTRAVHYGTSWGGRGFLANTLIDYAGLVGDNGRYNSIVEAVVGWLARNFPEAPVRVRRLNAEGEVLEVIRPGTTGPSAMLTLLERPNPWYSGVLQWMATLYDWACTGNAYWIKVRAPGSQRVVELWWAPSWMMEPKWDTGNPNQFIGWYEYTVDGVAWVYRPEDVVHFRDGIDPLNPRKGRSKLWSLMREIFTDDEASNMTAALMKNLGIPGVVISPANTTGPMGRFQDPEQVKEQFMEKFGGDKRGEPMVNTIPTEIKVLSWSPQQMDLRSLRKIPEERISAVYGVAAIVAGLGAGLDRSTFANFSEARKAAYQEAVIPAQRLFGAELEVQLLPDFTSTNPNMDVFFDWKQATAMQEAASEVWGRYQKAATSGLLTRSTFKRAVGEPIDDGDNVYVVPNNYLILKEGEVPPLQKPAPPPPKIIAPPAPKQLPPGNRPPPQEEAHSNGRMEVEFA